VDSCSIAGEDQSEVQPELSEIGCRERILAAAQEESAARGYDSARVIDPRKSALVDLILNGAKAK